MNINGYETKTTFWMDFSIADNFGKGAIVDTYKRAFKAWHNNVEFVTELALVLNWKCWEHYGKKNEELSEIYSDLYYKLRGWAYDNLKGDDLTYFWRTLD